MRTVLISKEVKDLFLEANRLYSTYSELAQERIKLERNHKKVPASLKREIQSTFRNSVRKDWAWRLRLWDDRGEPVATLTFRRAGILLGPMDSPRR